MDTITRGNVAEAAVLSALVRAGLHVYVPFGALFRVQVKCGRVCHECVEFNTCSTDHGRGPQSYVGRADVFGVHVPELDRVFVVPVGDVPRYRGCLRLEPARNNQRRGIRYASDHAVEDWARSLERPPA